MPYRVASLVVLALLAVLLLVFANPIAIWVFPLAAIVLVAVGVVRALQARRSPGEEKRS